MLPQRKAGVDCDPLRGGPVAVRIATVFYVAVRLTRDDACPIVLRGGEPVCVRGTKPRRENEDIVPVPVIGVSAVAQAPKVHHSVPSSISDPPRTGRLGPPAAAKARPDPARVIRDGERVYGGLGRRRDRLVKISGVVDVAQAHLRRRHRVGVVDQSGMGVYLASKVLCCAGDPALEGAWIWLICARSWLPSWATSPYVANVAVLHILGSKRPYYSINLLI